MKSKTPLWDKYVRKYDKELYFMSPRIISIDELKKETGKNLKIYTSNQNFVVFKEETNHV
jgi:hypothetical protein